MSWKHRLNDLDYAAVVLCTVIGVCAAIAIAHGAVALGEMIGRTGDHIEPKSMHPELKYIWGNLRRRPGHWSC
jgi:hypothetical protein